MVEVRSGTYTLDLKDFFIEFYCLIGCILVLITRQQYLKLEQLKGCKQGDH